MQEEITHPSPLKFGESERERGENLVLAAMKMKMERKERSPGAVGKKKKKKIGNKKRFSDKQIRYLESTFQEETKLEPERKLELAKELGLEPRQVAIWFQNRRARWKSKQLEQDYAVLRASYDELASKIDSIQKEKQCLLKQLQTLRNLVENGSINGDSHHRETKCCESEEKPTLLLEEVADMEEFRVEEQGLVNNPETANGFLTLIDDWCEFDSCCFSDQSSSSLSWWELWP